MFNQVGIEGKIHWKVVFTEKEEFEISAINIDTGKEVVKTYRPVYKPIFGIDIGDGASINQYLDKAIAEAKGEKENADSNS